MAELFEPRSDVAKLLGGVTGDLGRCPRDVGGKYQRHDGGVIVTLSTNLEQAFEEAGL